MLEELLGTFCWVDNLYAAPHILWVINVLYWVHELVKPKHSELSCVYLTTIKVLSLRETKLLLKVLSIEDQIRIGVLEWIFFSNLLHFSLAQIKTRIRLTSFSFPYSLSPNFDKTWLTLASNTSRIPMSISIHLCFLAVLAKQPVGSHSCTYDLFTIRFGIPKVGGKQTNKQTPFSRSYFCQVVCLIQRISWK